MGGDAHKYNTYLIFIYFLNLQKIIMTFLQKKIKNISFMKRIMRRSGNFSQCCQTFDISLSTFNRSALLFIYLR